MSITIPIEPDAKGYWDRECPSEQCRYRFKVHVDDWKQQIGGDVFCPQCRGASNHDQWFTPEQIEVAKAHAVQEINQLLLGSLAQEADQFNRQQQHGLIRLSMHVTVPERRDLPPLPSSDAYRLEISCEHCQFRFSVLGSAFFCPCCGRSSVERSFNQSLLTMRAKLAHARNFRETLASTGKPDEGVDIERDLIESCLNDCVTTYQCLCDSLWAQKFPAVVVPRNSFQRLTDGSQLCKDACGEGYDDWLTAPELTRLKVFFQRRHLLAHRDGIVDHEYINRSSDASYGVGQRMVVTVVEAEEMVSLIERLAISLKRKILSCP